MRRSQRLLATVAVALGCNVQVVEPETIAAASPRVFLHLLPQQPDKTEAGDPSAVWAAAVRRNLNFLTDPELGGRRPGTDGAQLTQSAITALFSDAGLIPSAPALGWTSPLGLRMVEVAEPKLTVTQPVAEGEPLITELTDEIWLHHRGAAGTFHLPMESVMLAPETQIADRLAVGVVPTLGEDEVEPPRRLRGFFDAVAHRGPGGCILRLPSEQDDRLRQAAKAWSDTEVQQVPLGGTPPAGLPFEGFVGDEGFAVLERAAATPGSKVDVSFEAKERWFEDESIVGRIAGRRKPEQVVLVTADWDAGGLEPPTEAGGAAQTATGIAVLLAMVERVGLLQQAGRVPARSIVFVGGAGGSFGHLGLGKLGREGIALPENIVAIVHLERLDWTAPTLTVVGGQRSTVGELVRELLPHAQLTEHEPEYGHTAFDLPRVPRVSLTRRGGSAPETLDPAAPLTNLANSARVAFDLVWELADASETPSVIIPRVDSPKPVVDVETPVEAAPEEL